VLKESIFLKVFAVAQIAKLSRREQQAYQDSLKYYRDLKNVTDTAREEGKQEGLEEGLLKGEQAGIEKAVLAMHSQGLSVDFIAATLGLAVDVIEDLINNK